LLTDGDVPAIELAKLAAGFLSDFLAAGDVEEVRDLLKTFRFRNARGSVRMCLRAR